MTSKIISKNKLILIDIIILLFCVSADRISKYFVAARLKNHASFPVIDGILEFRYTENDGAAFSLLSGQTSFLILVSFVVFMTGLYFIIKSPGRSKYIISHVFISIIVSGAIGNTIDRLIYGAVIDFIYLSFIDFTVFNLADLFSTVAAIGLVIVLIFYYKEDDLNFLRFKEKKIREL